MDEKNKVDEPTLKYKISVTKERLAELETENKKLKAELEDIQTLLKDAEDEVDNDGY